MATTPPASPPSMTDALNQLWARFLPEIEHRVSILEVAAQAHATGALTQEQREAAHAAAHKLAGSLGTFGLHRGTDLARQVELEFALQVTASSPAELSSWIGELRLLIDRRKL